MEKRKKREKVTVRTEQHVRAKPSLAPKAGKQFATYIVLVVETIYKIKQRRLQLAARKRRLSLRVRAIGSRVREDVRGRLGVIRAASQPLAAIEIRVDGIERSIDGFERQCEVLFGHVGRRNDGVGACAKGRRS